MGNRTVLRRDRNPPNRPPPSAPLQNPGTGQTRDLGTAAHPLRDTPRHERRRRHHRNRPRQPILHPQLPRHPPPGHQPGGLFPLKHSPPHSPKPPTKSPNDPTPHDDTEHIPEWSKDTEPTTTASNAPPTTANSTTAHPRSTSSKSPAKLNGIERTASTITSRGKRKPVNADGGGRTGRTRRMQRTHRACRTTSSLCATVPEAY